MEKAVETSWSCSHDLRFSVVTESKTKFGLPRMDDDSCRRIHSTDLIV